MYVLPHDCLTLTVEVVEGKGRTFLCRDMTGVGLRAPGSAAFARGPGSPRVGGQALGPGRCAFMFWLCLFLAHTEADTLINL